MCLKQRFAVIWIEKKQLFERKKYLLLLCFEYSMIDTV